MHKSDVVKHFGGIQKPQMLSEFLIQQSVVGVKSFQKTSIRDRANYRWRAQI
jgi:hypothetical protein